MLKKISFLIFFSVFTLNINAENLGENKETSKEQENFKKEALNQLDYLIRYIFEHILQGQFNQIQLNNQKKEEIINKIKIDPRINKVFNYILNEIKNDYLFEETKENLKVAESIMMGSCVSFFTLNSLNLLTAQFSKNSYFQNFFNITQIITSLTSAWSIINYFQYKSQKNKFKKDKEKIDNYQTQIRNLLANIIYELTTQELTTETIEENNNPE